jgi:hypothetical protein
MKREDLTKLGITDEKVIDAIMALHGKDVEVHTSKVTTLEAENTGLKEQVKKAGETIEGFKKLDVDGIKKAAEDYKAAAEKAKTDADAQIAALKFDHALEGALTGAKAKNPKAVRALLDLEGLKVGDDGKIVGVSDKVVSFEDRLKKVQTENDFLFEGDEKTPKIVSGGGSQTVITDAFSTALRQGAGLSKEAK